MSNQPKTANVFVKGEPRKQFRQPNSRQVKAAQLMSENLRKDKPEPAGKVLIAAGYSKAVADAPTRVIQTPAFQDLLDKFLPDNKLARTHKRLLETRKLEHMVFPLGPEGEDDEHLSGSKPNAKNPLDELDHPVERTTLSDQEIKNMLKQVNCSVKRIVHGQTARHVYYWTHDANAQTKALELAYKMKGLIDKAGSGTGINFNFGTQTFVKKVENNT